MADNSRIRLQVLRAFRRLPTGRHYRAQALLPGDHQEVTVFIPTAFQPAPGCVMELEGRWRTHPRFGRQFWGRNVEIQETVSADELRTALERLCRISLAPAAFTALKRAKWTALAERDAWGLPPAQVKRYRALLSDIVEFTREETQLAAWPLSDWQRSRLVDTFESETNPRLQSNPYSVLEVLEDFTPDGWRTLLKQHGISGGDDRTNWLEGWAIYVLREAAESGHTFQYTEEMIDTLVDRTHVAPAALREFLCSQQFRSGLIREQTPSATSLALASYHHKEETIAQELARIVNTGPAPIQEAALLTDVAVLEKGIPFSRDQRQAATGVLNWPVSVLTGGPGTGKTTTMSVVLSVLRRHNPQLKILCCAPTGQAAKRLMQATGVPATTIHRAIAMARRGVLDVDVMVMDEGSMLGVPLAHRLTTLLPDGVRLILVGDVNQLPSVEPGQVLSDIMTSNAIPVMKLTEVHRTANNSGIIQNAYRILQGQAPLPADDYIVDRRTMPDQWVQQYLVNEVVPKELAQVSCPEELQIITPVHHGPLGAQTLNRMLQPILNPSFRQSDAVMYANTLYSRGDRVIVLENCESRKIYNGDMGEVVHTDPLSGEVRVRIVDRELTFKGRELNELGLAYALTVHKTQGSEYESVIMLGSPAMTRLLGRELLNTASTRARQRVYDLFHPAAQQVALRRTFAKIRQSHLEMHLRKHLRRSQTPHLLPQKNLACSG